MEFEPVVVDFVFNLLKGRIKRESEPRISYSELSKEIKKSLNIQINHRFRLPYLLDQINRKKCVEKSGEYAPLITVLVVNKNKNMPGDGFFELAQSLERIDRNKSLTKEDKKAFAKKEADRVIEFYKNK